MALLGFTVNVPVLMKLLWSTGSFAMPCRSVHPLVDHCTSAVVISANKIVECHPQISMGLMGFGGWRDKDWLGCLALTIHSYVCC